jgi:CHASE2 domain-containing sensor protein
MKVSIFGVLVGGVVDVVSTVVTGLPFSLYVALKVDPAQRVGPHASQAVSAALHANVPLRVAGLLVGLLCSVLGGYVAATIAKRYERLNGTLSCYLCVGLGILSISLGLSKDPLWQQGLLMLASPAFAFVGGDLRARQLRSHRPQPAV